MREKTYHLYLGREEYGQVITVLIEMKKSVAFTRQIHDAVERAISES